MKVVQESIESATDEAGSTAVPAASVDELGKEAPRAFLGSARRNLSEEEASSPAGRRWLIAEVERLDRECADYRSLSDKYNDLRVKLATLEESQRKAKWLEIGSFVMLSVGSAGLGAAPSYMTTSGLAGVGWVFLLGSAILVIVGVLSKVFR